MSVLSAQRKIIVSSVLLSSIAAAVTMIFVVRDSSDLNSSSGITGYTINDDNTAAVFAGLSIALIALFTLAAFLLGKDTKPSGSCRAYPSVVFTSALSGFLMVGSVLYYLFYFLGDKSELTPIVLAVLISGCASAIYLLLSACGRFRRKKGFFSILSIAPIVFFAARLLNDFIRQSNSPSATSTPYLLLSLTAFMLFFLAEGKIIVGSGGSRAYFLFGFAAIYLSLLYSLPTLILSAFWIIPAGLMTLYSAIDLTLALYAAAKLLSFCSTADGDTCTVYSKNSQS